MMGVESFLRFIPLIMLVVGVGGFAFLWWTKRAARPSVRVLLKILAVAGLIGALIPESRMIWDGGYLTAEFQITFVDDNGKPVQGVQLCVEDEEGRTYFHYPVTDYLPDHTPTSGRDGMMVFHHDGRGIEFSGEVRYLFCLIPIATRRGPAYVCRFLHQDTEVHRIGFSKLDDWQGSWDDVSKVKRWWKWPAWPMSELLMTPDESWEHWHERAVRFFDLNGDGKLGPEEAAAFHAGTSWRMEEAAMARLSGVDKEEELEFPVVRKTITVHAPSR